MKKKLRKIVVRGQTYLWKFTPGYVETHQPGNPWLCQDQFTAYLAHNKVCPLQISFTTWEDPIVGGPLRTGLPLDLDAIQQPGARGFNFHTPRDAAWIIERALDLGWKPEQSSVPFVIEQELIFASLN